MGTILTTIFSGRNIATFTSWKDKKFQIVPFTFFFLFCVYAKSLENKNFIIILTDWLTLRLFCWQKHSSPLSLLSVLKMSQSNQLFDLGHSFPPLSEEIIFFSYFIEVWAQIFCCKNFPISFLLFFHVGDSILSFFSVEIKRLLNITWATDLFLKCKWLREQNVSGIVQQDASSAWMNDIFYVGGLISQWLKKCHLILLKI